MLEITVDPTNSEKRLDNYVAQIQDLTRSESKLLIKSGLVSVNGKIIFKPTSAHNSISWGIFLNFSNMMNI